MLKETNLEMRNPKRQRNTQVENLMKSRNYNQYVKRNNKGNNIITVNLAIQITETKGKILKKNNRKYLHFCVPGTVISTLHIFNPYNIFMR